MTRDEQQAVSVWPVPDEHWDAFSSGLHMGPKMDFVRWRLITLSLAEKAAANPPPKRALSLFGQYWYGTNPPTDRDERS